MSFEAYHEIAKKHNVKFVTDTILKGLEFQCAFNLTPERAIEFTENYYTYAHRDKCGDTPYAPACSRTHPEVCKVSTETEGTTGVLNSHGRRDGN